MRDPSEYAQAAHPIQPEESLEEEHQVHQQNWGTHLELHVGAPNMGAMMEEYIYI